MKFRQKPAVIEAEQFHSVSLSEEHVFPVLRTLCGHEFAVCWTVGGKPFLFVETPKGVMCAEAGDWIIRDENGAFHMCTPDIFKATYEPV